MILNLTAQLDRVVRIYSIGEAVAFELEDELKERLTSYVDTTLAQLRAA